MADASSLMTSSISSLSSSWNQPPNIARVYKQAFQLFVTRQTQEALEVLETITQPPHLQNDSSYLEEDATHEAEQLAPVVSASKNARIKVWNLYVSILNAVVEMGSAEGRKAFGASRWSTLVSKIRDGQVWEDIVQNGYGGQEGNLDPEVVASLATLLIAHAPSQKLTQQRLETYMSTMNTATTDPGRHEYRSGSPDRSGRANGTNIIKELNARLKIVEIFTLYVLPRNGEWDYAKEFINLSELLDDNGKESFLQTLQALQDEPSEAEKRERELQVQRDQELEQANKEAEIQKAEAAKAKEAQERKRVQDAAKPQNIATESRPNHIQRRVEKGPALKSSATSTDKPIAATSKHPVQGRPPTSTSPTKTPKTSPGGLYRKMSFILQNIQQSIIHMGQGLSKRPMVVLRTIFFIIALIMALARRDVRDRLVLARNTAWNKVKRTVGMGVKVSYI